MCTSTTTISSTFVVAVAFFCSRLTAVAMADENITASSPKHGDPCGPYFNTSLVCCFGTQQSTLVYPDDVCCNGLPVSEGQMCCNEAMVLNLTSPDHDACCVDPDTDDAVTYSSTTHMCLLDSGRVARKPSMIWVSQGASWLSGLPASSLSRPASSSSSFNPSSNALPSSLSSLNDLLRLPSSSSSSSSASSSSSSSSSSTSDNQPRLVISPSSVVSFPSMSRLCSGGRDDNVVEGSVRGEGEGTRCCGREAYLPSRQTCCAGYIHSMPAEESLCCQDEVYRKGDRTNPCLARCGNNDFNIENELCCNGVIHTSDSNRDRCCGRRKINPDTHMCCGAAAVAIDGPNGCCNELLPYVKQYMSCGSSGDGREGLRRLEDVQFNSSSFCTQALPVWQSSWPSPALSHATLMVEGRISAVTKRHRGNHLQLTLTPIRVVKPVAMEEESTDPERLRCLESNTATATVTASLEMQERAACRKRQLRRYLKDKIVTLLLPLSSVECGDDDSLAIRLPGSSSHHLVLISP